jgi:hypothetical protein
MSTANLSSPDLVPDVVFEGPWMSAAAPHQRRPGTRSRAAGVLRDLPAPPPHAGHPLLVASAELAAGSWLHALHTPWDLVAAVTGPATLTAAFVTHHLFDESGKEATFAATAVAATGGWLIWVAHTTPWSASSLGALVAINTVLGPIYGLLRWRRDAHNRKRLEARAQAREDAKRHSWEAILARAGAKDITVGPSTVFRAGFTLPLVLGPTSPDYRTLQTMIPSIERIAASTTGLPIRAGSIQLLRGEDMMAHQAYLVVPTRDVLAETIELPEWIGPRSITEPLLTGQYVDGNDVQVTLRGFHGMFAGMTRFGKTALLNTHLAQLVRCIDNVTWCLAGNKAVRWLRPWLLPWLRGYAAVVANAAQGQIISGKPKPGDHAVAGPCGLRNRAASDRIRNVHLDRRKAHLPDRRNQRRITRGKAGGVEQRRVKPFVVRLVELVDHLAFDVRVKNLDFDTQLGSIAPDALVIFG